MAPWYAVTFTEADGTILGPLDYYGPTEADVVTFATEDQGLPIATITEEDAPGN